MATKKFVSQENLSLFAQKVKAEIAKQVTAGTVNPGNGLSLNATTGALDVDFTEAKVYADTKVAALVNGAPETLDTLKEIADELTAGKDTHTAILDTIGNKADATTVTALQTEVTGIKDDYYNSTNLVEMTEAEMTTLCNSAFSTTTA